MRQFAFSNAIKVASNMTARSQDQKRFVQLGLLWLVLLWFFWLCSRRPTSDVDQRTTISIQQREAEQQLALHAVASVQQKISTGWQEIRDVLLRQKRAEKIAHEIRSNYLKRMGRQMNSPDHQVHTLTASCKFPQTKSFQQLFVSCRQLDTQDKACENLTSHGCFGLGERLRGSVLAFYLAIATNRVFHLGWDKESSAGKYFNVNYRFYDVSRNDYRKMLLKAQPKRSRWMLHRSSLPRHSFVEQLSQPNFVPETSHITNLNVMSDDYGGLEGIFSNEGFFRTLNKTIPSVFDATGKVADYQVAMSAALRVMLGQPNAQLLKLADDVINATIGADAWDNAYKIGIRITKADMEEPVKSGHSHHAHDDSKQYLQCFTNELRRQVYERVRDPWFKDMKIVVFISSDWEEARESMLASRTQLKKIGVELFSSATVLLPETTANFTVNAQPVLASSSFVDWHLLTKMDTLIVTKGGFGDTAAQFSLQPSWHYTPKCRQCVFEKGHAPITLI